MMDLTPDGWVITGAHGQLMVPSDDQITLKLAMLIEGQCEGRGVLATAAKFGYSKQRYYQLLQSFGQQGAVTLQNRKTGPKSNYRRTDSNVREVIRERFLDPKASAAVIAQRMRQRGVQISQRSVERIIEDFGLQKKLYRYAPGWSLSPEGAISIASDPDYQDEVEVHHSKAKTALRQGDPLSIERGVRDMLSNKVSGTMLGSWLLIPEHLRLGSWDILSHWAGKPTPCVESRLALQMVHEASLCVTGVREQRCMNYKGFELLNGLPFIATDSQIHKLLDQHTVAEAKQMQIELAKARHASHHYQGEIIAIDPHRMPSRSQRVLPKRCPKPGLPAEKTQQLFFGLDADTGQPIGCAIGSAAVTASAGSDDLLAIISEVIPKGAFVVADTEHYTIEMLESVRSAGYEFVTPLPRQPYVMKAIRQIPEGEFQSHWAGYATACVPYSPKTIDLPCHLLAQRFGEDPDDYDYVPFLSTSDKNTLQQLAQIFPRRWNIEEFFALEQAMGWKRSGTLNLNIRFARASFSLIAQAALSQFRQRLPSPYANWTAEHLATEMFTRLDGDIRVRNDTIIVTYYSPLPRSLEECYRGLPEKLAHERVDPRIPWLYGFKLDFRFK